MKGAVEPIMRMCTMTYSGRGSPQPLTEKEIQMYMDHAHHMGTSGLRGRCHMAIGRVSLEADPCHCLAVLALAYGSQMSQMVFTGLVGIMDPPRDGVREAVETLLSTGAQLKMVTGDSQDTAIAIGLCLLLHPTFSDL